MDKGTRKSEALQKQETGQPERVQQRPSVAPRVDIFENDQEVLLIADLPGVEPDSLHIHLEQDQLVINASRQEEAPGTALSGEFQNIDFHRAFLVPQGLDSDKISANLKDGVLHLHLPKSEAVRPRQIAVKAG
jgi:HSP20 family molecular chaperone IbpA